MSVRKILLVGLYAEHIKIAFATSTTVSLRTSMSIGPPEMGEGQIIAVPSLSEAGAIAQSMQCMYDTILDSEAC
jgi:hypothetical protein